jgi:IS66 C-terminal element
MLKDIGISVSGHRLRIWNAIAKLTAAPAAERGLRGIALGRKSWLFCGSDRGGRRTAAMYSLIVTAQMNGVDRQAWLTDILARIAAHLRRRWHPGVHRLRHRKPDRTRPDIQRKSDLAQALTAGITQSGWRPTPDAYGPPSEADDAAERRAIDRSNSLSAHRCRHDRHHRFQEYSVMGPRPSRGRARPARKSAVPSIAH